MLTHLHDTHLVRDYHAEYLSHINYYSNVTRNSIFVKYYNINNLRSTYQNKLESTYDRFHNSDIQYDLYDMTPAFYVAPIQNRSSSVPDLKGQQLDGSSSIVVYTIERPKIDDLLAFYSPMENSEIFRVANFTVPVNAIHANPAVTFFELELEYAPLFDMARLNINKHYAYDLSTEKYREYAEYKLYLQKLEQYTNYLEELLKFYDSCKDVYIVDDLIPLAVNETIIFFKKNFNGYYRRLFEKYNSPYSYTNYVGSDLYYGSIENLPYNDLTNNRYYVYNLKTNEIEERIWINKDKPMNSLEQSFYYAKLLWIEMSSPLG